MPGEVRRADRVEDAISCLEDEALLAGVDLTPAGRCARMVVGKACLGITSSSRSRQHGMERHLLPPAFASLPDMRKAGVTAPRANLDGLTVVCGTRHHRRDQIEERFMNHRERRVHGTWRPALVLLAAVLSALSLSACGDDSSSSRLPTQPTATLVTETFSGSIGQNESAVHNFVITNSGLTLLAGFTALAPSSVTALGLGIASWDPTTSTCGLNVSQNDTARSGNTGLTGTTNNGNYCLRVYDGGNIPAGVTVTYTLQVQHY
jgi:hypothetical protein